MSLYAGRDVFGADRRAPADDSEDRARWAELGQRDGPLRGTRVLSPRLRGRHGDRDRLPVQRRHRRRDGIGPTTRRSAADYLSGIRDVSPSSTSSGPPGARTPSASVAGRVTVHARRVRLAATPRDGPGDTTLGAAPTDGFDAVAYVEDEWRVWAGSRWAWASSGRLHDGRRGLPDAGAPAGGLVPRLRAPGPQGVVRDDGQYRPPAHDRRRDRPAGRPVGAGDRPGRAGARVAGGVGRGRLAPVRWTSGRWRATREMDGLVAYRDDDAFSAPIDDWQDLVETGRPLGRRRGVRRTDRRRRPGSATP